MTTTPTVRASRTARRPTLVDVARRAGVSTASASKVVRGDDGVSSDMRRRVSDAVDALGYRPHRLARGMRGHTFTVGVMMSDIENEFFSLMLTGLSEVFSRNDYELLIAPATAGAGSQDTVVDSLIDHQMDGLVLFAPRSQESRLAEVGKQIPLVSLGPHGPAQDFDTVSGDDEAGAALVVDYLVAQGHERIAFLTNSQPADRPDLPESSRERGFVEAMERHGLGEHAMRIPGEWSHDGGRRASQHVMESYPRPTAVFAGADVAALGVLAGVWESGLRVPEDLSVVGYDNTKTGALPPIALTSVDQSGKQMGTLAARLLLERIHGRSEARSEVLTPRLVVRKTTGPR